MNTLTRMFNSDGNYITFGTVRTIHSRVWHTVLHSSEIRGLVYANICGGPEADGYTYCESPNANPITVKAALEVRGVSYPLNARVGREATLQSGETAEFYIDGPPILLEPGDEVISVTRFQVEFGWLAPRYTRKHYTASAIQTGDALMASSSLHDFVDLPAAMWPVSSFADIPFGVWGVSMIGPANGLTVRRGRILPAVEVWGTSRTEDFPLNRAGRFLDSSGVFGRALSELGMPYVMAHRGASQSWRDTVPERSAFRTELGMGSDIAIWDHGVNDWHVGRTVAQFQETFRDFCRRARRQGKWVLGVTAYPNANSTDGYSTLEGQIPKWSESRRVAANNWIRGLISDADLITAGGDPSIRRQDCMDDYIEAADAIESARDSGLFYAGTVVRTLAVTAASGKAVFIDPADLVPDAHHDQILWISAGTGAGQFKVIVDNDASRINVYEAFSIPPDTTSEVKIVDAPVGLPFPNGLHASQDARARMAQVAKVKLAELVSVYPSHPASFVDGPGFRSRGDLEAVFAQDGTLWRIEPFSSPLAGPGDKMAVLSFRLKDFHPISAQLVLRGVSIPLGAVLTFRVFDRAIGKWLPWAEATGAEAPQDLALTLPDPRRHADGASRMAVELVWSGEARRARRTGISIDQARLDLTLP